MNLTLVSVDVFSAFTAGLLAFFSPYVLPLLPIFLGILFSDIKNPKLILKRNLGFFIGLSLFFSLLGVLSGSLSMIFVNFQKEINIVMGILIIIFGFMYMFNKSIKNLGKIDLRKYKNTSFFSAFFMGVMISIVWIPCSGPILGAIMSMAASKTDIFQSIILLFSYSLGISLPFIFIGGSISKLMNKIVIGEPKWIKILRITGGIFIIIIGILILTGNFNNL